VGDALAAAGDEWSTVCYFYAAYHIVKHALTTDPVFQDSSALIAIHPQLTHRDRYVGRHHGRRLPGEWGVNDLVLKLYPAAVPAYERLHQASIAVRYQAGLTVPVAAVRDALTALQQSHSSGGLRR